MANIKSSAIGSMAQKLAVDSFRNIANVDFGAAAASSPAVVSSSEDVLRVVQALAASGKMSAGEVAQKFNWNSNKTAETLAAAQTLGVLDLSRVGETFVANLKTGGEGETVAAETGADKDSPAV